jgi:hypothetical protein
MSPSPVHGVAHSLRSVAAAWAARIALALLLISLGAVCWRGVSAPSGNLAGDGEMWQQSIGACFFGPSVHWSQGAASLPGQGDRAGPRDAILLPAGPLAGDPSGSTPWQATYEPAHPPAQRKTGAAP